MLVLRCLQVSKHLPIRLPSCSLPLSACRPISTPTNHSCPHRTRVLVLGCLQVGKHLLGQLRQEAAMDQVVLWRRGGGKQPNGAVSRACEQQAAGGGGAGPAPASPAGLQLQHGRTAARTAGHQGSRKQRRCSRACLMKISRRRDWPKGLYLRLNLSNLGGGGEAHREPSVQHCGWQLVQTHRPRAGGRAAPPYTPAVQRQRWRWSPNNNRQQPKTPRRTGGRCSCRRGRPGCRR